MYYRTKYFLTEYSRICWTYDKFENLKPIFFSESFIRKLLFLQLNITCIIVFNIYNSLIVSKF